MSLESQLEVVRGEKVQAFARDNLNILNDIDGIKNWQPSDLLPDISKESDALAAARAHVQSLSLPVLVVLIGDMITEEGLPTYMSLLNRTEGIGDTTGVSETPFAQWIRGWTAEENRHGDALNTLLRLNPHVNMRSVETTVQHLIANGFDNRANNLPYQTAYYTTFQEWATMLSHHRVAEKAKRDGDDLTRTVCKRIAGDEARHERFYGGLMEIFLAEDPSGAVLAIADMVKKGIVMPAERMVDNKKVSEEKEIRLFDRFARVAAREGIYTPVDYMGRVDELVQRWHIGSIPGLSPEAAQAQDELSTYAIKRLAVAEKMTERLKRSKPEPFAWINGNAA